jgi:large subunit ribosomal protein L10
MPKTRQQKEELVSSFADRLNRSASVVLVAMSGIKVGQVEAIRDGLFPHGLQLQVAKNSLLKRVLEELKIDVPSEITDQPLGLVYSYDDVIAGPKAVEGFKKEIDTLQILGGIMDGKYVPASSVEALAKLPSRQQLLGQLAGTIAAPLSGLVNVLQGNIRGLVTVMGQIRDAKA